MLFVVILLLALTVGFLAMQVRILERRLRALERRPSPSLPAPPDPSPLAGVRIAVEIAQDHPNSVFAELLREALRREEAVLDGAPQISIRGEVVSNGYADVYYRAELVAWEGSETLFTLSDRPIHGDRPANLALETVQRLRTEWTKRERRQALRELA